MGSAKEAMTVAGLTQAIATVIKRRDWHCKCNRGNIELYGRYFWTPLFYDQGRGSPD